MAVTHFITSDQASIQLVNAPNADKRQYPLIVIDFISVHVTSTSAVDVTVVLDDGTNTVLQFGGSVAATSSDTIKVDYPDGFPIWKVALSGSHYISTSAHATVVSLSIGATGATTLTTIGYHYERPVGRR